MQILTGKYKNGGTYFEKFASYYELLKTMEDIYLEAGEKKWTMKDYVIPKTLKMEED